MKALKLYMKMKKRDQRRFGPARAPPAGWRARFARSVGPGRGEPTPRKNLGRKATEVKW